MIRSWTVGALPIINRVIDRLKLEEILGKYLGKEDRRTKVPVVKCLGLLVRNILVSREPLYGLGEWSQRHAPDLLGLLPGHLEHLNDDRVGRALDKLFVRMDPQMLMEFTRRMIKEFDLKLDELHNDSTSVTFFGAYSCAASERFEFARRVLAVTWGHNKDHRPDLKQLLYVLTITEDGGVPLYYSSASGNTTDDQTHRETWDLLRELVGHSRFLYVADCKLATSENMAHIQRQHGRFVSVLPKTRREDSRFRAALLNNPGATSWELLYERRDANDQLIEQMRTCQDEQVTADGYRLLWYHSMQKQQCDRATRARAIERATRELNSLREKLGSAKTRYRDRTKVQLVVDEILKKHKVQRWIEVEIDEHQQPKFKQTKRGRPTEKTRYVKIVSVRFSLTVRVDHVHVAEDEATDGIFPLVTNDVEMTPLDVIQAYKRQPIIEKRFSQFKTDFEVAPVFLKRVRRIQALLGVYFFALVVQTLVERELRQQMDATNCSTLPLYPEERGCAAPTARRIIDLFTGVQRHRLTSNGETRELITELSPIQRAVLRLLRVPVGTYGRSE